MIFEKDCKDECKLIFNINEHIENISFLFERISVMSYELTEILYRKNDFTSENEKTAYEQNLRVARIHSDIICECIMKASKIFPLLLDEADTALKQITKNSEIK